MGSWAGLSRTAWMTDPAGLARWSAGAWPVLALAWPWAERHRDIVGNWTDVLNFMDLIPGPAFLLVFILYAVAVAFLMQFLRKCLQRLVEPGPTFIDSQRIPFRLKPTFLEVAYLRGGRRGVLEAATCNLYRLGVLTVSLAPASRTGGSRADSIPLTSLETAVYNALMVRKSPGLLKQDAAVDKELSRVVEAGRRKLSMLGLLPTLVSRAIAFLCAALGVAMVLVMGLARLNRSELRGYHNVEFLELLCFVLPAIVLLVVFHMRCSHAGSQYVAQLRGQHLPRLRRLQGRLDEPRDIELMYAVAAFGAASCGGTVFRDIYEQMRPPRQSADSWSGCSGGSCGGGGCGGGGCGGGGCGGG